MTRSEALALVATLQAAFPAGSAGQETVGLYATQFERYQADHGARSVRLLVETRHEAFLPTWAEILDALSAERPRPVGLPEPEGVPPTPEARAAMQALAAKTTIRGDELRRGVRIRYLRDHADQHTLLRLAAAGTTKPDTSQEPPAS